MCTDPMCYYCMYNIPMSRSANFHSSNTHFHQPEGIQTVDFVFYSLQNMYFKIISPVALLIMQCIPNEKSIQFGNHHQRHRCSDISLKRFQLFPSSAVTIHLISILFISILLIFFLFFSSFHSFKLSVHRVGGLRRLLLSSHGRYCRRIFVHLLVSWPVNLYFIFASLLCRMSVIFIFITTFGLLRQVGHILPFSFTNLEYYS